MPAFFGAYFLMKRKDCSFSSVRTFRRNLQKLLYRGEIGAVGWKINILVITKMTKYYKFQNKVFKNI